MPAKYEIHAAYDRESITVYQADWTVFITDLTPLVRKLHALRLSGRSPDAARQLAKERVYPLPQEIAVRIGMAPSPH